jgi:hypothetical protein
MEGRSLLHPFQSWPTIALQTRTGSSFTRQLVRPSRPPSLMQGRRSARKFPFASKAVVTNQIDDDLLINHLSSADHATWFI